MRISLLTTALALGLLSANAAVPAGKTHFKSFDRRVVAAMAKEHPAPATRAASLTEGPDENDKVIETPPEGESKRYYRTGTSHGFTIGGMLEEPSDGTISDFVTTKDGKVYFSCPFGLQAVPGWIEGTRSGDIITIEFPQLVRVVTEEYGPDDTETYYDYCMLFEWGEDEEGEWYFPSQTQTYTLKAEGDRLIPQDDSMLVGMANWMSYDEEWGWMGIGDQYTGFYPLTITPAAVPDNLSFEKWNLISGINGRQIDVAFDGDDIYVKGFVENQPEHTVKGKSEGDKAIFDGNQYLGLYDYEGVLTTSYFTPVTATFDGYGYIAEDTLPAMTMDYDRTAGRMTTADSYCIATTAEAIAYFSITYQPVLAKSVANPDIKTLLKPQITTFYPKDDTYPAEIYFDMANVDAEGNLLDMSRTFWNLIVDGEEYTFKPDLYTGLDADLTDVPFSLTDTDNFFVGDGNIRGCSVLCGFNTLGVRAGYTLDNGDRIYSPISYVGGEDSIDGIAGDEKPVSTEYFNIDGTRADASARGIVIARMRMSDGSFRYTKRIAR